MRNLKILLFFFIISFSSCLENSNNKKELKQAGQSEKTKDIMDKTIHFDNEYIANEKVCNRRRLPYTSFKIEYPMGLQFEFPNNKKDHIRLSEKKDGIIIKELSIGSTTIRLNGKSDAKDLLKGLSNDLKKYFPNFELITIEKTNFNYTTAYTLLGNIEHSGRKESGYDGKYKTMFIIPFPNTNKDINAVIISLSANEQSDITSFSQFNSKKMLNGVLGTFQYLE